MSAINVNSITGRTGSHGPVLTGVTTISGDLHVGGGVSFSGIGTYTNGLNVTSGSVGIGTDNPGNDLEIASSGNSKGLVVSKNGVDSTFLGHNGTGNEGLLILREGGTNKVQLYAESGQSSFINSGNVGVGTNIPDRRLDVVDSGVNGAVIRSKVTTNNGGYLAYEALNSSGTSVFSVSHNGRINLAEGINFQNTGAGSSTTETSHLLDDYEEGTWTPVIGGSNVSGSLTYGGNNGARYVKIGRSVFLYGLIDWSANNLTAGTSMYIGGLPFLTATGNVTRSGIRFDYTSTPWTGVTIYHIGARTEESATHCIINYAPSTNGSWPNTLNYNNLDSDGAIIFSGQYMVD